MERHSDQHDLNSLAAFLEGRLDPLERREIERRLADCVDCRETLAVWSRGASSPANARPASLSRWLAAAAALAVAGWLGYRVASEGRRAIPPASPPPAAPAARATAAVPRDEPPATAAPSVEPAAVTPEPLQAKRGTADRRVGNKTFRLVAGEWIDAAYDPIAGLPETTIRTDAARAELLAKIPALAAYARLGRRVTVVQQGTVYRFVP